MPTATKCIASKCATRRMPGFEPRSSASATRASWIADHSTDNGKQGERNMLTIDKDEVLLTALHIAEANLQTASQIIQRQNETIERIKPARRDPNIAEVLLVPPLVVQMFQTIFA